MTSRTYTVKEYAAKLSRIDMKKAASAAIQEAVLQAIVIVHRVTDQNDAVNTGAYKRGWRMEKKSDGARLLNNVTHAPIVEGGRRPGKFPPIRAIEKWAQQKLGLSKAEAKAAAYPIARAIKENGIDGKKIMEQATPEIRKLVREKVKLATKEEWLNP